MNLILYLFMAVTSYLGALHEMLFGRTNRWLFITAIIAFVLTACSRIGYDYDYSDLNMYLHYFMSDEEAYFEPGYVFFTDIIKFIFGYNSYALIASVSVWVVAFVTLSTLICTRIFPPNDQEADCGYQSSFLFIVILYWGCCFACEGLRNGMTIPVLFCVSACAICKKYVWAILISLFATLLHYSVVLLIPGVLLLALFETIEKKIFYYWFFVLLFLDVLNGFIFTFDNPLLSEIFNFIDSIEELSHYNSYEGEKSTGYFTTQYITYHVFGLLALKGNMENERYNRAVFLYFIGLSLGTIFQSFIIAIRLQWLYLSMIVFVLYFYIKDNSRPLFEKHTVICSYALIESIMVLRFLGWHI